MEPEIEYSDERNDPGDNDYCDEPQPADEPDECPMIGEW